MPPTPRLAARVLLIDAQDRVLLLRFVDRLRGTAYWITPGGGLKPHETHDQAARRELAEETGLRLSAPLGPAVWEREVDIRWGERAFRQHEYFFVHRVVDHRVDQRGLLDYEREELTGHRWWTAAQITASPEAFAPRSLGPRLAALLRQHPAATIRLDD